MMEKRKHENNKFSKIIVLYSLTIICLFLFSNLGRISFDDDDKLNNSPIINNEALNQRDSPEYSSESSVLFQGREDPLNITDMGIQVKTNQHVIVNNEEEVNLSYYLDTDHDWESYKIETTVYNLQDNRNWVNNSDFDEVDVVKYTLPSPIYTRNSMELHT